MNLFTPPKLIKDLHIRFGENPVVLLSLFSTHATQDNWCPHDILNVIAQAKKGNYMSLIKILRAHIQH